MKRLLLLSIGLMLFLPFTSYAQSLKGTSVPYKLIEWSSNSSSMPYPGYVIFGDNDRLNGQLEIKRKDGYITVFRLTADGKEHKLKPQQVAGYGYYFKPNYFSPEKKAAPQLFQPGSISTLAGEVRTGYIAFVSQQEAKKEAPHYQNVLFAPTLSDTVSFLPSATIGTVEQTINGQRIKYQLQPEGFTNVAILKAGRQFLPGQLALKGGQTMTGLICRRWFGKFLVGGIFFKDMAGTIQRIDADAISRFSVNEAGQTISYLPVKHGFVAQEKDLGSHLLLRNPFPTRTNPRFSIMKDGAKVVGNQEVITSEIVANASSPDVFPPGLCEQLKHASGKQLWDMEEAIGEEIEALGQDPTTATQRNVLAERRALIRTTAVDRKVLEYGMGTYQRSIYFKEWLLRNKTSGVDVALIKAKLKDSVSEVLSNCHAYLVKGKKEKKELADWSNLSQVAALLSGCQ